MGKVIAAFHDSNQKKPLSSKRSDENLRCVASYRRMVFSVIRNLNEGKIDKCSSTQRKLVIKGLTVICEDKSPGTLTDLKDSMENVLAFLITSFDVLLFSSDAVTENERSLKRIIQLIRALTLKSEHFLKDLDNDQDIFEQAIDKVMAFATIQQKLSHHEKGETIVMLKLLEENILKSQLVCKLCSILSHEATTISCKFGENEWNEVHTKRTKVPHYIYSEKISAISTILMTWRNEIKSIVRCNFITSQLEELFSNSTLVSSMVRCCDLDDFLQCSHALKIFVIIGENPALCDIMVKHFFSDFTSVFMAMLRAEEPSPESILTKFWLVKSVCNNASYRSLVFLTEGGVLEILAVLRAVNMDVEGGLSVLSPFRDSSSLLDMSLTNAQLIQHFGSWCQCDESPLLRQQAFAVLQIFSQGLDLSAELSSSIASSFIESDVLFCLVNSVGNEDDGGDRYNDDISYPQDMGMSLLCVLLEDSRIRKAFLCEPLGVLQCLSASRDPFCSRCSVTMSLVKVLDVVITDEDAQGQLFDCNVVKGLVNFIRDVLSSDEDDMTVHVKVGLIRRCLHIFDVMVSCDKSRERFNAMNFADFLRLLLLHDDKDIISVVSDILNKLKCQPSPEKWKSLFDHVEDC